MMKHVLLVILVTSYWNFYCHCVPYSYQRTGMYGHVLSMLLGEKKELYSMICFLENYIYHHEPKQIFIAPFFNTTSPKITEKLAGICIVMGIDRLTNYPPIPVLSNQNIYLHHVLNPKAYYNWDCKKVSVIDTTCKQISLQSITD